HGAACARRYRNTEHHLSSNKVAGANATVYTVSYKYFAVDPDPNCPCVRRSVAPKDPAVNPVTGYPNPIYYTEVQNVIDPTGMAQVIFTYFQASGDPVDVGAGININTPAGLSTI